MIFSDCQLKCLAEMHSFSPHRENTSYFHFNKGSGAHIFCILLLCTYNSILSGGEKYRGVGLLSCLLIKCEYYNLVLCLQLYLNYIMVVVIATREFNNVQTRSR